MAAVTVRYFAVLRERRGRDEERVDVRDGTTVAALYADLFPEQQRARVGLMGVTARITEREQSGRTVYRVRIGPYDRKEDADQVQEKLAGNGVEAALVRVER